MIVVAKDGSGNFTSIQAAVDSLPETAGLSPSLVLVRAEADTRAVGGPKPNRYDLFRDRAQPPRVPAWPRDAWTAAAAHRSGLAQPS